MTSRRISAARRKKSSKRSGAKRKPPKQTYYVDECLGRHVPEVLLAAGYDIKPWYDHFAGKTDIEWLPAVGARGWVVFTKDKNIRRNYLEIQAILNSGVRAFVVTATDLRKEQQAEVLLKAMPKIERLAAQRGPFIFNITRTGYLSRISIRFLRRKARKS